MYEDILNKPLHTFTVDQLGEIKRMAETIFEPLVRPFRQKRVTQEFSFRETIKTAQRIGQLLPTYVRQEREHRKSRLLICMSLSGIDRCSAVSLIPLFSCLQATALNFRLFIYTDDMIQAEFTRDGFLANDWKLAWNHVAGPIAMKRLLEMPVDEKEDTLLLIDSLGGGDSKWYDYWSYEESLEVKKEQEKYMSVKGRYGWANSIRQKLAGNFDKFHKIKLPKAWEKLIERNCQMRWKNTPAPALKEYMMRWVFHPEFGTVKHGEAGNPYCSALDLIRQLKGKYRSMHLLTPNLHKDNSIFYNIRRLNVFDYHHQTNTPRGFADVLAAIVHGSAVFDGLYTKKISYEEIKLGNYNDDGDFDEDGDGDKEEGAEGEHTELIEGTEGCFTKCPQVEKNLPEVKAVQHEKYDKKENTTTTIEVPYSQLDVNCLLPTNLTTMAYDQWWKLQVVGEFSIDVGDSEYTRVTKAQRILDHIKTNHILCNDLYGYGLGSLHFYPRYLEDDSKKVQDLVNKVQFDEHHTGVLRPDLINLYELLAPCYYPYMEALPLQHVVWCTDGMFKIDKMAVSVSPKDNRLGKRETLWHESLHHLENVCPPVGVFANQLIRRKCGSVILDDKLITVAKGEYAMPVLDGTTAWIIPYAGKWYIRKHPSLPNPTEVLTVYGQYFASPKRLAELMRYDPFMVRFIAFIFMGGPVAAMKALENIKKCEALAQIRQKERRSKGFKATRVTGGRGGGGRSRGGSGGSAKKGSGFGL